MARRGAPIKAAWLLYLCASQHVVQLASALRAGGAWGERPECPKPSTRDHEARCDWYLCEHKRYRKKMEHFKNWVAEVDLSDRHKDFLKVSAADMFKAYKFAVRGADEQCAPWGATIGDDFATWADSLMPEAYGCIRVAMQLQAGMSESKCKEGFTRQFQKRLRRACSTRFDAPDQKERARNKKIGKGVMIGIGALAGLFVLPALAGLGVAGLAATAIAFQVCKKYLLKKPRLGHQLIFDKPEGVKEHQEWPVDEAGPNLEPQEQQEETVEGEELENIFAKPSGPKGVDDLIAFGDDELELDDLYMPNVDAGVPSGSTETPPSWQVVPETGAVALPGRTGTPPSWQQTPAQTAPSAPWQSTASTNSLVAPTNPRQSTVLPAQGPMAAPTNPWQQATPAASGPVAAPTNPWQQTGVLQRQPFPASDSRRGFPAPAGTQPHRSTEEPKRKDFFSDLVSFA